MFGEARKQPVGLGDLLLWYGLVEDGVMLQHDGSLVAAWSFRGPDLQSATHTEMNAIATRLASILRLGSGWMVQVDSFRTMANEYGPKGAFPDRVTALIDEERRVQFQSEGSHFESEYFLALTYLPPVAASERLRGFMISGSDKRAGSNIGADALRYFTTKIRQFEDVFSSQFPVKRLRAVRTQQPGGFERVDDELLSYLRRCLTGVKGPVMLPEIPVFLNDMLAMEDFLGGMEPKLADRHLRVLSVDGFPRSTWPGALSVLDTVACEYRWHTRIILMDTREAEAIIEKTRKKWRFQTRGFKDQIFKSNGGATNMHAVEMAADAEGAISEAAAGEVQYGYFSSSIVLQQRDLKFIETMVGEFRKALINRGFGVRIETVNAVDAFFGTMPGNRTAQIRRPMAHTRNFVDLMPISAVWAGESVNPSALMPPNSPPLVQAATSGGTPFRLNLHYQDVGHSLLVGPTGSGKSVAICLFASQWFRYPNAQVFAFDKGHSLYALCKAAGGRFYDIGEGGLAFQPLRDIEEPAEFAWGTEWVETLMHLQDIRIGPAERQMIHRAVRQLAESPKRRRTLTELEANLQDDNLKAGLKPYVIDGPLGRMLDASDDSLVESHFIVCEMETLLSGSFSDATVMAVLLYLFRRMERSLNGRPTFVPIDEAWLFLRHPAWRDKIQDWLKTLRKKNAAVLLATQSIADVKDSPIASTILQSTSTKIYLPNSEAGNESMCEFYRYAGLNSREVEILQRALPKREYYVVHPLGRRLISFRLGPVALSFLGVSSPRDRARINALEKDHGEGWVAAWLSERHVSKEWIAYFKGGSRYAEEMAS
jgi:type IV secretion/conjugal transfer VirB4 family ATPase